MKSKNYKSKDYLNNINFTEVNDDQNINSKLENTDNVPLNLRNELILNKRVIKIKNNPPKSASKNRAFSSFNIKNGINFFNEGDEINIEKWFQNKIKILLSKETINNIVYNLYSEEKGDLHNAFLSGIKAKNSYLIQNNKDIEAKIAWNMFSNHFKIYDKKDNLIEEIVYNFNFKGWNGPTKLQILIPKIKENIKSWTNNKNKNFVYKMQNKLPEYSDYFKCYVLNFIRRKIVPNEKNMQIIYSEYKEDKNNILLQFGQSGNNEYILDFKYPFNYLTAFSFALTILSSRTLCQ